MGKLQVVPRITKMSLALYCIGAMHFLRYNGIIMFWLWFRREFETNSTFHMMGEGKCPQLLWEENMLIAYRLVPKRLNYLSNELEVVLQGGKP